MANAEHLKSLVKDLFVSAPDEIANAVTSDGTLEALGQIATKHNLDAEKRVVLEKITTDTILGLTGVDSLQKELTAALGTTSDESSKIVADVTSQIISKIPNDILKKQNQLAQSKIKEHAPVEPALPVTSTVIAEKQNDLPMIIESKPKTEMTFEERKKYVPQIPDNKTHYQGGVDPYREQV
jgi:hypothetical protein